MNWRVIVFAFVAWLFCVLQARAASATYFLAPGGSDSNAGKSLGAPWRTPNHAIKCGDTIVAAAGVYTGTTNFNYGSWGTVDTAASSHGQCVAFLKCAAFAACTVTSRDAPAMFVTSSNWGIMGFLFSQTATTLMTNGFACVQVTPASGVLAHFIIANNVFNGCYGGAVSTNGDDYVNEIANVVYNSAQTRVACTSGISFFQPANVDALPGTHLYAAQNIIYNNVEPSTCGGIGGTGAPSDGEAIIFDTFGTYSFTGQTVAENNIGFLNGAGGFEVCGNTTAKIYIVNNTAWANHTHALLNNTTELGEFANACAQNTGVEISRNIAKTNAATATIGKNRNYAFYTSGGDASVTFNNNFGYSAAGNHTACSNGACAAFSFGPSNTLCTDPGFANAPSTNPGAPNCSGYANVPECMATIIGDFRAAAAPSGWGYQQIISTSVHDPLYPQWLCQYSAQLSGLITQGCLSVNRTK